MTIDSRLACILCFVVATATASLKFTSTPKQISAPPNADPLEQRIEAVNLENEYFIEGLAKLNLQTKGIGFAVEFLPGTKNSAPPPDRRLTAQINNVTVKDALNWLCSLDHRYTWTRDGLTVNVIPRDRLDDPQYLFNRKLSKLAFTDLVNADDTLQTIFRPVSNPAESVIQLSGIGTFPKPWSAKFENITVRAALNRVAENLGVGHGWMVTGNEETRLISFYEQLLTKAESENRKQPRD